MRFQFGIALILALAAAGCSKPSDERRYTLEGQITAIPPDHQFVTVKHGDIKGFMPAMTMAYTVKDPKSLEGITPGDLIKADLVVVLNNAYLTNLKKVGTAPLEPEPQETPSASSGFELLKPGEAVPDVTLVDQDGRKRDFKSFRGSNVVLTFIYTRCPMPAYCPLMDRQFAAIQRKLAGDHVNARVHLVSVSFDPKNDTPAVLKDHARSLKADPKVWTFLTGDRDDVDKFASRFGVQVARDLNDPGNITHNLRTAIIDPDGKLVKVYTGNEWTPDQVMADLKGAVPAS
jgi:protein SCO1/2